MKTLRLFLYMAVLTAAASISFACSDDDPAQTERFQVQGYYPAYGMENDVITIYGKGFGTDPADVAVNFTKNSQAIVAPAQILSVSDGEIEVKMPANSAWSGGDALGLQVIVNGVAAPSKVFTYIDGPQLISLSKTKGVFDEQIEINGQRFDATLANNAVAFGSVAATLVSATAEKIVVKVPYNYVSYADVTVTTKGKISNPLTFTFDLEAYDASVVAAAASWTTNNTVQVGVNWKRGQFKLFNANRSINVIEIDPATVGANLELGIAYAMGTYKKTSAMCVENSAIAGINGGYFTTSGAKEPIDYLRVAGVDITQGRENYTGYTIPKYVDAALVLYGTRNNTVEVMSVSNNVAARNLPLSYANVLVSGPLLVTYSEVIPQRSGDHFDLTHPRTAIGVTSTGKILMVTVDGRFTQAVGMSTTHLAQLMKYLGAKEAMNLDGGGSTTMYVNGQADGGIVNYPCDNATFDHAGERSVGNAIFVK